MKWLIFGSEIYFLAMAIVFLILSMMRRDRRLDFPAALFLAGLGVAVTLATVRLEGSFLYGAYRIDLFSQVFKGLLSIGFFLVICLCSNLNGIREKRHPEFFLLLATCTLGMMLLVSSLELLTMYVALELASYSLYALVPMRSGGQQTEAGIKYFLAGISTSALMLFGMASLFGATQTTYISVIAMKMPGLLHTPMAFIGLLLTLCGFFFKLALFPFHVWAPNVYQGAANQVTAFLATATKVTAMAMLVRLVSMSRENTSLAQVLIALAILSMTYGNLVALIQKDFKRLLAYSAIAHAGYSLIGILSMNPGGYASTTFYALAYLAMTFTCFWVVVKVAPDGRNLAIAQLAGLHRRSPLLAMALLVAVFSLGGIPPTIGFTGKFLVFTAAMQKGYFLLVVIAMINVVVSLYYYIQIVRTAFLLEPEEELPRINLSIPATTLTVVMIIAIIAGGIWPRYLVQLATTATKALL
ncbi:MAG: NADH-quinone oxidoreductase subunit N [Deltaproteobacteria bacterium RBG_16_49_23]|nr:MAG: NADH-quinone oxidoreductase subunit N [Deltaproteobacteria bacterium RBG_16_49_23]